MNTGNIQISMLLTIAGCTTGTNLYLFSRCPGARNVPPPPPSSASGPTGENTDWGQRDYSFYSAQRSDSNKPYQMEKHVLDLEELERRLKDAKVLESPSTFNGEEYTSTSSPIQIDKLVTGKY